jgi:hypothetical protein
LNAIAPRATSPGTAGGVDEEEDDVSHHELATEESSAD